MTEESLRHTDSVLLELVEMVETARAVPMSSSVVVPRERVLDLLDELRETMPPEMDEARRLIAARDQVLYGAHTEAAAVREKAEADAQAILAAAKARAGEIIDAGQLEHERRVSQTEVSRVASAEAARVREEAGRHSTLLRADADAYAGRTRTEADTYAARMRTDAEQYAERTLAELGAVLQRAAVTAEQGRAALVRRRQEPSHANRAEQGEQDRPSAISA